ncbi:NAD(P)/FAD-dependent oxidoreductase [Christiangramia sp.]|uniref:NAD(P)/FAD-dependent oxidoreductase n=1 Tax=Christiangramia sp. TaxID=1931228 RepID=UPI00262ECFEA|nr:NAD(P)/FAD-dependent oxidoreductase [Christiangramia sp.]
MQNTQIIIIGGGLAGLTAAIHLCRSNLQVVLLEKENYPHHKVCGEYLSQEIIPYLEYLELDLSSLKAPKIDRLRYSTVSGKLIEANLEMGGIGVSRYSLDHLLYTKAKNAGCELINSLATEIEYNNQNFRVTTADGKIIQSQFVLGAFGKRSNLDKKLKRKFIQDQSGWLAVKAHYKAEIYPENLVSLHNFQGGYCGLSRTDLNTINVCYLATYESFKNQKNTGEYKEQVLMKNPHLNEFFQLAEMDFKKELSIAQVCFDKKSLIENHILMIGDSAGLIHPLCGNGMAMAIHSAKIAAENLLSFYNDRNKTRRDIENNYRKEWNQHFRSRIRTGRILQKILLNKSFANISQGVLNKIPGLLPQIIKRTHGKKVHV